MTATSSDAHVRVGAQRRRFSRLYRAHFGLLWSIVRSMGVNDAHREDVLQEVWLRVHRRLHTLDPGASTKAWLCAIARNVVLHHHRAGYRRNRKIASLAAEPPASAADPLQQHEARDAVTHILDGLDAEQRSVLVLAQVHGFSGPEIADGLGIPLNTAYSRLRLARQHVRRAANDGDFARAEHPPPYAARKAWALLVPRLGQHAKTVATAGVWATAKFWIPSAAVATAALGVVAAITAPAPTSASLVRAAAPGPIAAGEATEQGVRRRPDVADASEPVAPTILAVEAVMAERAQARSPIQTLRPGRTALVRPGRTALRGDGVSQVAPNAGPIQVAANTPLQRPSPPAAEVAAPSELEKEARLLKLAQEKLAAGKADAALDLLRAHRDQFPAGQLADAREGAWVRALCKAGRAKEARARAALLAEQRPGSTVSAAVRDACEDST